jgi:hypothetical protein
MRRELPGVRPRCPRLPAPYNSRSAGKLCEAASFHDSWGTWQAPEESGNRAPAACSFGHVNDVVLGWAYRLLLFAPFRLGHSMAFPPRFLLLFEPVLLQTRQGRHTRVRNVGFTAAFLVVQVHTALGAKSPAIAAADDFHRQRQKHLFGQDISQEQSFPLEKSDFRVVELE